MHKTNLTATKWDSLINTFQQDFFFPNTETHSIVFLKARIVIFCQNGFEIMDITESESAFILHPISF